MRMQVRRIATAAGAGAIVCVVLVASAFAGSVARAYNNFDNMPCQWSYGGTALGMYWKANPTYPPSGDYASAFSYARSSWNATSSPVIFIESGSAPNLHGAGYFGTQYYGITWPYCSGGYLASTSVYLNKQLLDSGADPYSGIFWQRFTAGHELGHTIGLGHSSVSPALMISEPNQSVTWNTPRTDDVCGVRSLYPSTTWPAC
jgi:hypothetical protein